MKVIITGATGMIGKGVLLECLDHPAVSKVLVVGRSSVNMKHPKLTEQLHDDFEDYSKIRKVIEGYDACFFCLGISAVGLNEKEYSKITYDYTIALAKELHAINPEMTFIYVSGQGTNSSEKGGAMWARVKGKTENSLLKIGFRQAYMFRPGMIIPLRGIKSRTKAYQFIYDYLMWLVKALKMIAPNSVCNTTQIGKAMIHASLNGYQKSILNSKDIIELSAQTN